MTNVENLQQAGLIHTTGPLTAAEITSLNQLSPAEVQALISIKAKLGDDFFNHKVDTGDGHRLGTLIL